MTHNPGISETLLVCFIRLFGVACMTIALAHLFLGAAAIVGAEPVSATLDSEDRFFAAIFLGFGGVLLWTAGRLKDRRRELAMCLVVFFVGGAARIVSYLMVGSPHPFHILLMILELAMPPILLLWLARGLRSSSSTQR